MVSMDAVIAKSERNAELAEQIGLSDLAADLRADTQALRELKESLNKAEED